MFYYDWTMILLIPGLILGLIAQARVKSAFEKSSKQISRSGLTADQIAGKLLYNHGCEEVRVHATAGNLTDHYDPRNKTLALSSEVYGKNTLAAIGVAAHEAGHAIQDSENYMPLKLRSALVPAVNIGTRVSPILFILGIVFSWNPLITIGIIFFSLTVIFSLVTLPVEIDASKRAKKFLVADGYLSDIELKSVDKVLDAAAMTYVAALISGILQLLRLVLISRSRRD